MRDSCNKELPSPTEDYFSVFGLPRRFSLDRVELEKRFYQLSRVLHPDRFTTANLEMRVLSLERMSLLNQAYAVLKSVEKTRDYLIKLENTLRLNGQLAADGGVGKTQAAIPQELAEAWFDLQEVVLENPTQARAQLDQFQSELSVFNEELNKKMSTLESNYDLNPSQPILEKLEHELQAQSYIKSMERDLERLKKNAYSN